MSLSFINPKSFSQLYWASLLSSLSANWRSGVQTVVYTLEYSDTRLHGHTRYEDLLNSISRLTRKW